MRNAGRYGVRAPGLEDGADKGYNAFLQRVASHECTCSGGMCYMEYEVRVPRPSGSRICRARERQNDKRVQSQELKRRIPVRVVSRGTWRVK